MKQKRIDHVKVERLLKIIQLLSSNIGYSITQLAERIEVSERTIQRYLRSFTKAGLLLHKKNGYYKFERKTPYFKDINDLLHFSEEEAVILNEAINSIESSCLTKQNLKDKLFSLYNIDQIAYPAIKKEDSGNVRLIIEAIRNKKSVKLIGYKSANSGTISDRIIEPFDFTTNYIHLWAFEPKFERVYLFRISRIHKIEILSQNWSFESKHKKGTLDVFRMNGENKTPVKLKLTLKGYNYLIEQYPLAKEYVSRINDNCYSFSGWYANLQGVGKFILSAMDDVEIITPNELKDYLNRKIKNKKF